MAVWSAVAATLGVPGVLTNATARSMNGFDLSNARIPVKEILSGGPPRDGIPAIDRPQFWSVSDADGFLRDDDIVLGVARNGHAKAYPLRILVWHEIVNDSVGGDPVVITYCPLCGTGMAFSRRICGLDQPPTFGVSGLLYQSDVLMYDRTTESLWSQLAMEAVAGPMAGKPLEWLPSSQTTWVEWKRRHPEGLVLSTDTGHRRDYNNLPYVDYHQSPRTMFPVPLHRRELRQKAWVAGVIVNGVAKAYPLKRLKTGELRDHAGNTEIIIRFDPRSREISAQTADGQALPTVQAYWFAWQAFYPDTELWSG